jgi:hypothetical protein
MKMQVVGHQKTQSFYEKKAMMANLKRKWKEEHGRVSIFDKRHIYK